MKRIIRETSYVTRCPYCDAEFTYQHEDTYLVDSPEKCRVVTCPKCGRPKIFTGSVLEGIVQPK